MHTRSGIGDGLPAADAIYVNAALSAPSWGWLEVLRPGGRLIFPLQAGRGLGGMLLVTKPVSGGTTWPARFVSRAAFIRCDAPMTEDDDALAAAFAGGGWELVRSFRLDGRTREGTWFRGDEWALSTEPPPAD
ncbi:hypothetical protein [Roseomonas chloroacetimidivorans]|uniref:hypothetical protein n=1 Tax=Roseomonas chloroacetimidivorans TaxID=1766656 RepID=UPI003C72CD17